ncbi:MAG: TonB-dependent receptor [Acidobacteria bacterium]|nr:TonB-dependent receptor [Acidobacteriota bacterium]
MQRLIGFLALVVFFAALPSAGYAQATITGVVRDTSGGVLPGVTVEAASPALIEKVRAAVTDGTGQYRIIDLRPGVYAVTFTLPGFGTVRREGVELQGTVTVTVNADMRVGGVEETITVTGEAPVVDVQTVTQQRVMDRTVLDAIPTGRTVHNMAALIPGMVLGITGPVTQDVGGSTITGLQSAAIHGGRTGDQRVMMDGLPLNTSQGNISGFIANPGSTQEFTIDISGVSAEDNSGGVRMNIVPREGGNTFSGTLFVTGASSGFQSTNFDEKLAARGFSAPDPPKDLDRTWDVNPAFGGPMLRDRLWFYSGVNWHDARTFLAGKPNANAGNPDSWVYSPAPNGELFAGIQLKSYNTRVTWQAHPKHKLAFFLDYQDRCRCPEGNPTEATEATVDSKYPGQRFGSVTWSAPLTNRLLLDAALLDRYERWGDYSPAGANLALIQVTDSVSGMTYHGQGPLVDTRNTNRNLRASVSFVTGAHAFKAGFMNIWAKHNPRNTTNDEHLTYTFTNGVPTSLTMYANPRESDNRLTDFGMFVQDRWTINRLTLSGGLRYDYLHSWFPAQTLGPARWTPARNISIGKTDWTTWHDVTPRMGAAYNVFGNGKTGLKVTLNKYLGAQSASGGFGAAANPLNRVAATTNRNWNDGNGDFVPDCDLLNPSANGECGPYSNRAFGTVLPATNFDPDLVEGFGVRFYNWELALSVQHEVAPRMSVEVGYFRRWYGNFIVTDNRAVTAADFDRFSVTAPTDSRLPGGGGDVVSNLYNVKPASFGRTDNVVTLSKNFGDQTERWHGVDLNLSVRDVYGLRFQGGMSTGNTLTDNCEIRDALPEIAVNNPYCRVSTKFITQVKGLVSYVVPRIDVQVSAGVQNIVPGAGGGGQIAANWNASNAVVLPSLGRPLSGNASNISVNLVEPGTRYLERSTQVDLRLGKIFRPGGRRASVNLDLYNAFNSNSVLGQINNFGPVWQRPIFVLPGRLAKLSATFDF